MGAIIGTLIAGNIVKYGRKRGLLISNALLFIALVINLISSEWLFNLGKFIHGVAAGFFLFFSPVYLNEFVPVIIRGTIGGSTCLFIGFGAVTPLLIEIYSNSA